MTFVDERFHERTLIGAIDTYLGHLVHVRPHLVAKQREHLEVLSDAWTDEGGANAIEAITPEWLKRFLEQSEERVGIESTLQSFYGWAVKDGLTDSRPIALPK